MTMGLRGALSLTVTAPLMDPFTLGVKVTLNVHVAPDATEEPQGMLPDGTALKSPLASRLEMASVPPELLVSVTVFGALVVPMAWPVNERLVGATVTGTAPVPESAATCGLPG